jgi:hypothetical protein
MDSTAAAVQAQRTVDVIVPRRSRLAERPAPRRLAWDLLQNNRAGRRAQAGAYLPRNCASDRAFEPPLAQGLFWRLARAAPILGA